MSEKHAAAPGSLVVNGNTVPVDPEFHGSLLTFIRNDLQLTGTKSGCATGNCGACTVLIDNTATQACQVSLAAAAQNNIQSIEHIAQTPLGQRITTALIRYDAAQCGYCLPGIVVAAYAELQATDTPQLPHALRKNLCRCGAHSRILAALRDVIAHKDS